MNQARYAALCVCLCASAAGTAAVSRAQATLEVDAAAAALYGRPGRAARQEQGAPLGDGVLEVLHAGNEISVGGERFAEWPT